MKLYANARPPAVGGVFYPDDARALRAEIAAMARATAADSGADIVIAPHAGYRFSGSTAALAISALAPGMRRIIVIGPSHHVYFSGISVGAYRAYRTPLGDCPVDEWGCRQLLAGGEPFVVRPDVHEPEHAVEVLLPMLQTWQPDAKIIPLIVGDLPPAELEKVAECLRPLFDEHTALVISTDFTHYGPHFNFVPFPPQDAPAALPELDHGSIDRIMEGAPGAFLEWRARTGTTICGYLAVAIGLHIMGKIGHRDGRLLAYTNSGEITGSWTNAVGYAAIRFAAATAQCLTAAERKLLLNHARACITARLQTEPAPAVDDPTDAMLRPAGAFVSLHLDGKLRGCIGTIEPVYPLLEAVTRNAANAAFADPRFLPVSTTELEHCRIEISVLSPPQSIPDSGHFIVGEHGIILEVGRRRAVFLPQVAPEQGWSRIETLRQLARKAGLTEDAWNRSDARLSIFTAQVFAEPVGKLS